jgi:carbon monoxide dehydrogenase subunit G
MNSTRNSALSASGFAAVLLALVWLGPEDASALSSDSRTFSAEEEQSLRAGQLVVRPTEVVRGGARLMGGLSWQLVTAPPERVWRAMTDVRAYSRFLPAVEEARFVEQSGADQRIFIRHKMGFVGASYFVLATNDAENLRVRFKLDRSRPSSIRDAFGELRVSAYPGGRSVVSLAILADVGEGLIAGLVRKNVHEWMLRVPEQLKKFVESKALEALEADTATEAAVTAPPT